MIDSADPENYVELRGRVTLAPDPGRQLDTQLSWKYDGRDPDPDRPGAVRVVVRMVVEKATGVRGPLIVPGPRPAGMRPVPDGGRGFMPEFSPRAGAAPARRA